MAKQVYETEDMVFVKGFWFKKVERPVLTKEQKEHIAKRNGIQAQLQPKKIFD